MSLAQSGSIPPIQPDGWFAIAVLVVGAAFLLVLEAAWRSAWSSVVNAAPSRRRSAVLLVRSTQIGTMVNLSVQNSLASFATFLSRSTHRWPVSSTAVNRFSRSPPAPIRHLLHLVGHLRILPMCPPA